MALRFSIKDLTERGRHQQIRIVDVQQSKAMDRVFVHFYASEGGVIAGAISLSEGECTFICGRIIVGKIARPLPHTYSALSVHLSSNDEQVFLAVWFSAPVGHIWPRLELALRFSIICPKD